MKNARNKFMSLLLCICMMFGMMQISVFAAPGPHVHTMEFHQKSEATCVKSGMTQDAWKCSTCGKWYEDEAGKVQLTEDPVIPIDADNHEVLKYDEIDEYYHEEYCEECGYADFEYLHEYVYPSIYKYPGNNDDVSINEYCTCGRKNSSTSSGTIGPHIIKATAYFDDIAVGSWYENYVFAIRSMEIMTGLSERRFGPTETLSRAMFAVILYRMCGSPYVEYTSKFADIPKGTWYTDAVIWASKNGIVTGYQNGTFGPANKITREQMAVMMYRYAKYKKADVSTATFLDSYKDASKVSGFAEQAMRWAVDRQIITGKQNGTALDPQGYASRAECATIIIRYLAYIRR